jgi:hypothetical protein
VVESIPSKGHSEPGAVRMGLSWIKFVPIVANSGRFACARTAARQCLGRETQTWANQDDADAAPLSGYCRLPYCSAAYSATSKRTPVCVTHVSSTSDR